LALPVLSGILILAITGGVIFWADTRAAIRRIPSDAERTAIQRIPTEEAQRKSAASQAVTADRVQRIESTITEMKGAQREMRDAQQEMRGDLKFLIREARK